MNKLKSLLQFNKERYDTLRKEDAIHTNGIACPKCNSEMMDGHKWVSYGGKLEEIEMKCPVCGNTERRLA